ncbi:FKBP-type peptidyl-prolyl cis-trans isomerase [Halalkalibaculum sp. DA384]|uniref:FKBP-type peptidyl-prolyl cis-trans isomerase n=1 Tax=Halalkalibaculum sp. DA384 TaxID=3373606 RepID=UPI0037545AF3
MRSSITTKPFLPFVLGIVIFIAFQGCGDNDTISGPDFSTVPAPWDISGADSSFTLADGDIAVYVLEKGNGIFEVNERDQISVYYTGRLKDGTVFTSTWANGNTAPRLLAVSEQIEGFRRGVIGMSEGERRTVIIPPSYGYGNSRPGTNGYNLRNDTLIYDIELDEIDG